MTMLYSLYTSEGIVFAADSRIVLRGKTDERGKPRPKVIRVRRCGLSTGLIGYYGLAQVKGKPMSDWLLSLIASWPGSHEPEDFADLVVESLNREAWARERREVSGFHFGAFRRRASHVEPVFFHIVNTTGFDTTTGLHTDPVDRWQCEEQLMGRDVVNMGLPPARIRWYLKQRERASGMPHWYRNGDMPVFGPVTGFLEVAIGHIVRVKGYRAPTALTDWQRIARVLVVTTSQVARAYYKGKVPTIGDKATALAVEWP
jgi:hypothetical protein